MLYFLFSLSLAPFSIKFTFFFLIDSWENLPALIVLNTFEDFINWMSDFSYHFPRVHLSLPITLSILCTFAAPICRGPWYRTMQYTWFFFLCPPPQEYFSDDENNIKKNKIILITFSVYVKRYIKYAILRLYFVLSSFALNNFVKKSFKFTQT